MPAIETTSGVRMVQSHAITHYLGRSLGMDCNCEDLHFCEIVAAGVGECTSQGSLERGLSRIREGLTVQMQPG